MYGAQALFSSLHPLDFSSLFCPPPLSIWRVQSFVQFQPTPWSKVSRKSLMIPLLLLLLLLSRNRNLFFLCVCVCVCIFGWGKAPRFFSFYRVIQHYVADISHSRSKKKKKKTRKLLFTKNPWSGLWSLRMINVCRLVGVIYELRDQVFEWLPSFFLVVPFVFIQTANLMSKASFIEWVSDQM